MDDKPTRYTISPETFIERWRSENPPPAPPPKTVRRQPHPRKGKSLLPDKDTLVDLYVNQGLSLRRIGKCYGVTVEAVRRRFIRLGIADLCSRDERIAHTRQRVYELCVLGSRDNDALAAAELGITPRAVARLAVLLGGDRKKSRIPRIDRAAVLALHHQGLTQTEIAGRLGCTQGYVSRVLIDAGYRSAERPNRRKAQS